MQNDVAVRVGELNDRDLLVHLKRCVAEDREVTARLLEHFAEVDARGLYRDQGFSSMFEYAVCGLHMSDSEAGLRITVSRLVRQFPQALEMLGRGEIHLTALRLLAPRLTSQNLELLQAARFKSKHEVQMLIALHFPQRDVSDSIRRLPAPRAAPVVAQPGLLFCPSPVSELGSSVAGQGQDDALRAPSALPGLGTTSPAVPAQHWVATLPRNDAGSDSSALPGLAASSPAGSAHERDAARGGSHGQHAAPPAASVPLSEGRYKVQFTVGQRLYDKLRQAQELMRHRTAHGDLAIVLENAIDLLIAERKKQLFGKVARPRGRDTVESSKSDGGAKAAAAASVGSSPASARKPERSERTSRYVPRAIRREVAERAQERCTFVAPDGHRCSARGRLELDHRVPHGRGGPATAENLRVLCRSHNLLMAERAYGSAFMRERIDSAKQTRASVRPLAHNGVQRVDSI